MAVENENGLTPKTIEPAVFEVGETVIYTEGMHVASYLKGDFDGSKIGRVVEVIPRITYTYRVEWADGDPTDEYGDDSLSPVPPGVTAASYRFGDRFKSVLHRIQRHVGFDGYWL